ncbi:hypothetical protein P9112_013008 [Eukaryota sp. TZLM1-RC]
MAYRLLLNYLGSVTHQDLCTFDKILSLPLLEHYDKYSLTDLIQSDPLNQITITSQCISLNWYSSHSHLTKVSFSTSLFLPLSADLHHVIINSKPSNVTSPYPLLLFSPESFQKLLVNSWYFCFYPKITHYAAINPSDLPLLSINPTQHIYLVLSLPLSSIYDVGPVVKGKRPGSNVRRFSGDIRPGSAISCRKRLTFNDLIGIFDLLSDCDVQLKILADDYFMSVHDLTTQLKSDPINRFVVKDLLVKSCLTTVDQSNVLNHYELPITLVAIAKSDQTSNQNHYFVPFGFVFDASFLFKLKEINFSIVHNVLEFDLIFIKKSSILNSCVSVVKVSNNLNLLVENGKLTNFLPISIVSSSMSIKTLVGGQSNFKQSIPRSRCRSRADSIINSISCQSTTPINNHSVSSRLCSFCFSNTYQALFDLVSEGKSVLFLAPPGSRKSFLTRYLNRLLGQKLIDFDTILDLGVEFSSGSRFLSKLEVQTKRLISIYNSSLCHTFFIGWIPDLRLLSLLKNTVFVVIETDLEFLDSHRIQKFKERQFDSRFLNEYKSMQINSLKMITELKDSKNVFCITLCGYFLKLIYGIPCNLTDTLSVENLINLAQQSTN